MTIIIQTTKDPLKFTFKKEAILPKLSISHLGQIMSVHHGCKWPYSKYPTTS